MRITQFFDSISALVEDFLRRFVQTEDWSAVLQAPARLPRVQEGQTGRVNPL